MYIFGLRAGNKPFWFHQRSKDSGILPFLYRGTLSLCFCFVGLNCSSSCHIYIYLQSNISMTGKHCPHVGKYSIHGASGIYIFLYIWYFASHVWWPPHTKKQTSPSGDRTASGHGHPSGPSAAGKRAEEWEDNPLLNVDITNWKILLLVPGKLAISTAMFNGYVELPEGIIVHCPSGTSF